MKEIDVLLYDEKKVSKKDLLIRHKLIELFSSLPKDFLSKMRCFQPQIGCANKCGFCSQYSSTVIENFDLKTLKNIIAALKVVALKYTRNTPLLAWDRTEHRVGVVFPYLDNDIGNYHYLYDYIRYVYNDLKTLSRISTVAFSRKNLLLTRMHKKIVNSSCINGLGGCRLSISQFGRVWEDKSGNFDLNEYEKDIAHFLKIYKPYYDKVGSGSRDFCIELRFNPLVKICDVFKYRIRKRLILAFENNIYISQEEFPVIKVAHIQDPHNHFLKFDRDPTVFYHIKNDENITDKSMLKKVVNNILKKNFNFSTVEVYLFKNSDGPYYSINPKLTENGNYGLNIYLKTPKRKNSGVLSIERFLLNAILSVKRKYHIGLNDNFSNATWKDVNSVLFDLKKQLNYYQSEKETYKSNYIKENIIPMLTVYIKALKSAKYEPKCFFDKNFTIDTGTICNLGRGIRYFKGLVSKENEPLTPIHERNYGRISSTMTAEKVSWRLRCYYNNTLEFQKVNLKKVSFDDGPVIWQKKVPNIITNERYNYKNHTNYTVPGEK